MPRGIADICHGDLRGREPTLDAFRRGQSTAQQDVQAVHRVRQQFGEDADRSISYADCWRNTALCWFQGVAHLRCALPVIMKDCDNGLSGVMRELLGEIGERLKFIEEQLRQYDLRIQRLFRQDERCKRLAELEGVGPADGDRVGGSGGQRK